MLERLRNNLGLKALALALAVGAWAYFRFAANPAIAAHFDQQLSVPIVVAGLASDEIARFPDKQAVVTIVSPRGATTPIRPDDLRAVLDLSGRPPGVHAVAISVIAPRLEVKSVTPASETLQIERISTRSLPVAIRYTGDTHGIVTEGVHVQPDVVGIRGATGDLERVTTVRLDVPLPQNAEHYDAMLRPVAVDAHGDDVANVTVAPNLVRVRATFHAAQRST